MTDIGQLPGIREAEASRLRKQGIDTIDALWARIGADHENGIVTVAQVAVLDADRLTELLADYAVRESARPVEGRERRYWPEVVLSVGIIVLVVLVARALGVVEVSTEKTVVATDDFEAGRVLRSGDLTTAPQLAGGDIFREQDPAVLTGLILNRPIGRGMPLRHADVSRVQVAALKDIPEGALIADDAVGLRWTFYDPNAALTTDGVVGRTALKPIRLGSVVLADDKVVSSMPGQAQQLVVVATAGIPQLGVIRREDVDVQPSTRTAGALSSTDQAVGRYALADLSPGAVISAAQISSARVARGGVAPRELLAVPVTPGGISPAVGAGQTVSLLLVPRERGQAALAPTLVNDVAVDRVDRRDDLTTVVVAVEAEQVSRFVPLLGTSDVYVLERAP
jgi:flagella basal body P-ring formation protein FlgA